ncbi:MAG: hypothetical protein GXO91_08920 [FCB group bacterium]|nr:hypothetical protein [FCB group bacterium]
MFDLNLLGKPGIQPQVVETAYSFIEQKPKPAVVSHHEEYAEEPPEGAMESRRLAPILIPLLILLVMVGVYFFNTGLNKTALPEERESLSVQDEISQVISMLGNLSDKVYLQRFLLTPEIILVNLRSDDQIELNMLSAELEDLLKVQCRISGSKEFGVLLSISIPIEYESRELNDTIPVKKIMEEQGLSEIRETGLTISATVRNEDIFPLLQRLLDDGYIYYKKCWIECRVDENCLFQLLYDASATK